MDQGPKFKQLSKIVKHAFDFYDADKSGDLDPEELEKLQNDICDALELPALTKEQLEEALYIQDENGDGEIQYEELLENIGRINDILMRSVMIPSDPNGDDLYKENPNFIKGLGRQIKLFDKQNCTAKFQKEKERKEKEARRRIRLGLEEVDNNDSSNTNRIQKDYIPIDSLVNTETVKNGEIIVKQKDVSSGSKANSQRSKKSNDSIHSNGPENTRKKSVRIKSGKHQRAVSNMCGRQVNEIIFEDEVDSKAELSNYPSNSNIQRKDFIKMNTCLEKGQLSKKRVSKTISKSKNELPDCNFF